MFPLAALAGLGTRVSAFLTQAARRNPKILTQVADKLSKGGTKIAASLEAIVAHVKSSPLNATMVVGTIASLGYSIVDVFSDPEEPAVREHLQSLQASVRLADGDLYARISDLSVAPELNVDIEAVRALKAQSDAAVKWAKTQFGSGRAAADAFDRLEYLASVPSATRRFLLEG